MILDWLAYGLFTWGLVALLNRVAFAQRPASSWVAWTLTVAMFFVSLIAMTALQYFRYQALSDGLGFQIKPRSPLDVVGALTFSWVFYSLLRRSNKARLVLEAPRTSAPVSLPVKPLAPSSAVALQPAQSRSAASVVNGTSANVMPLQHPVPSEAAWAAAAAEFDTSERRPGLWARVFSEANGNESVAKAAYLRQRASELEEVEQSRAAEARESAEAAQAERRRQAEAAELQERERAQVAAKLAHEAIEKGVCPNHKCRAIIPLKSQACPSCGAIFEEGAVWKVLPWKKG